MSAFALRGIKGVAASVTGNFFFTDPHIAELLADIERYVDCVSGRPQTPATVVSGVKGC